MSELLSLLKCWAELEPERCQFYDERDITLAFPGFNELAVFPKMLKISQSQAIICGMIEAAIVEREDWQLELKGDFEGWEIRIWVRSVTRPVSAPTKLEALLSAYVQALEATRD